MHFLNKNRDIDREIYKWICKCSYIMVRAGNVPRIEQGTTAFKILIGTPIERRSLGKSRRRWKDNIRMDLEGICINTRNLVDSSQDRDYLKDLVNAVMNLRVSLVMDFLYLYIERYGCNMYMYILEEGRSAFKILTFKPTGKRPLGRPRRRWEEKLEWTLRR